MRMPINRLALLTMLSVMPAFASQAQTLRERLEQGASRVQQGAAEVQKGVSGIADRIGASAESSVDLMTDEATPQATRDELDAMAAETLSRLFAEKPEAVALFEQSAGYAVFDTRELVLFGVAAGAARGVAASRSADMRPSDMPPADLPPADLPPADLPPTEMPSPEMRSGDPSLDTGRSDETRIYMNMATGGVGVSFGLGGFETQVVILFKDAWDFNEFVTQGYDATAEAGSMFGAQKAEFGVRFVDGRAIFHLTGQGWKVSATAAGTRYWIDQDLN
jgi:hypothetical protein